MQPSKPVRRLFHTAEGGELIEIIGDPASGEIGSSRAYLAAL